MAYLNIDKMVRLSVRAIRVAQGAADRPEMVGIGLAVKSAAEAFLSADQELLRKEVELPGANQEASEALKKLGRVYDSVRITVISHLDPPLKYFSASSFNVPDDLLGIARTLKASLESNANVDWCLQALAIFNPALREAEAKLLRKRLVFAVEKLQNERRELFDRMEFVLVRFRKRVSNNLL